MEKQQGRIVGDVTYREGDGTSITIPPGHCEFTVTELDATLTWDDGDTRGSTALPLGEYQRFVDSGAIELDS
jgi:hypothetical protein